MDKVFTPFFYRKAIKGVVGGRFINRKGNEEEFLLKGDPAVVDSETISVEIYDELGLKFFKRANKLAIQNGYLITQETLESTENLVNSISDGKLKDMLKLPFATIKKNIAQFTSPVPLHRLLDIAVKEDKPIKTIELIRTAISVQEGNVPSAATIDDVKIRSI